MFELKGKYNSCKVFTDVCDNATISQLTTLLNQEYIKDSKIRIMSDCHAGSGCTIGTTITLLDKVCPNIVGVDIGCLDKDSEVLTPEGWIKISEYNGEKILIYDKDSEMAYFSIPYAYIKQECDEFLYFHHTKGLDLMHSKEHKMLIFSGYKKRGYNENIYTAEDFFNKLSKIKKGDFYSIKTTFNWGGQGLDIDDNVLRVLIAESADGRIKKLKNGSYYSEFHFKKERKILRIKELLNKCNINFSENIWKDGSTCISFSDERIDTKDLRFLYKASKHQLETVADEIFKWDGTIDEKRNHLSYSTTIKTNADVVQWVFACLGIRAGIYVKEAIDKNHSTLYSVYLTKNEYVSFDKKEETSNPYELVKSIDGFKYCFTTETGFFIMRRNNNIAITGNCGMRVVKLKEKRINLPEFDSVIKKYVPAGFDVHEEAIAESNVDQLIAKGTNIDRAMKSLGTLGGGNHFIELDKDEDGNIYLVIHTGSRHLGIEVCKYYQDLGYQKLQESASGGSLKEQSKALVDKLKSEGREKEISKALTKLKEEYKLNKISIPHDLAYVEGQDFDDYIHDMKLMSEHAALNRATIAKQILKNAKLHAVEEFETVHNYIDTEDMILRKGAVSAQAGEKLIIPMNMRDGSLICIGKGNHDWNYSAPHGAGRIMSRSEAKESVSMKEYKESMEGIYSSCVNRSTIDESPMAYKPMESIIENIGETVDIISIIKPIYNFKAGESD